MNKSKYKSVSTRTRMADFCVRNYERDISKLSDVLQSTEVFYKNNYDKHNNNLSSKESTNFVSNKSIDEDIKNNFHPDIKNINENNKETCNGTISEERKRENSSRLRYIIEIQELSGTKPSIRRIGRRGFEDNNRLSTKGRKVKAKKKFYRPKNFGLPFFDNSLDPYFSKLGKNNLPTYGRLPTRSSVEISDQKTFEAYTSDPLPISTNMSYAICGSMLSAFDVLGLSWKIENTNLINPLSVGEAINITSKNTNSGWDLFGKKNDPFVMKSTKNWMIQTLRNPNLYKIKNSFLRECKNIQESSFSDLAQNPVYMMHRFQISPVTKTSNHFEVKTRAVWCIPYKIIGLEAMFFNNAVEQVKATAMKNEPIFPIGLDNYSLSRKVALPLHRSLRRCINRELRSFDFSKFDQSIESIFTSFFYTIWGSNINFSENHYKVYEALRFYTMYTPFIDNKQVYLTRKGVCSGSFTTNLRDTICNLTLIILALKIKRDYKDLGNKILNEEIYELDNTNVNFRMDIRSSSQITSVYNCSIYGDDGIILEDKDFFMIHKFVCQSFGFTIKYEDSTSYGNSFYYLGRFWDVEGKPWNTTAYLIAHIQFRTRWYKKEDVEFDISKYLTLYRVLSICLPLKNGKAFLYDNLYNWRDFREFLDENKGFYLLKEWPNEGYIEIPRRVAFNLEEY